MPSTTADGSEPTSRSSPFGLFGELVACTAGRWDLLVMSPEASAPSAARLMAAASANSGPPVTATALMTAEQAGETSSYEATSGRPGRLVVGV
ncbi:hypothetical protein ABZZ74_22875 [Streptomyces sp. NPDC006476]|uniref:hypothetical protein n=1 Tax=Streptomyces sp. NPDC006476 TaxID=3157175 RepID=UPI0033BB1554